MARKTAIGIQDFGTIREENCFYVDKTDFIREWWESGDAVTLITRPRRFGKTLTMSMIEQFFSVKYAGRGELFEGLSVWREERYRQFQGTYPVISLSFANIKETSFETARKKICLMLADLYADYTFLMKSETMEEADREFFRQVSMGMDDNCATMALHYLSKYLSRYYGKKVIILLDEYDTPMQEAYVGGYWEEMVSFTRSMFNAAFKTNPWLERAIMTGITRVSRESIFSDLNHLEVVTTTSEKYAKSFGFTEEEVFDALDEFELSGEKKNVKKWYDGFTFGRRTDIYNPWSILNYLDKRKVGAYWANSSSNSLAGKLVREASRSIKQDFEGLMRGESIYVKIDEQIVYSQLEQDEQAIWSLLLASGYLRVESMEASKEDFEWGDPTYELRLTNYEVKLMFHNMVRRWFSSASSMYNDFIQALLLDDLKAMNTYMNEVALKTFSYFRPSVSRELPVDVPWTDTGKNPARSEPERFYHGFVLGLMMDLADKYILTSNRESGFGRYDVMLEPRNQKSASKTGDDVLYDAVIMEFKVQDTEEEELSDTVREALAQIERKGYETSLVEKGIPRERIRKYGFAFCGKKVLIGR